MAELPDPPLHPKRARWVFRLLIIFFGLSLVLNAVVFIAIRQPAQWDPLGEYETPQHVTAPSTTSAGQPVIDLSEDEAITVVGTKCNDTGENVEVAGTLSWQQMEPPGAVIEVGTGTRTAPPGCETTTFENQVPPEVAQVIRAQHRSGIIAPAWRISGVEWPVRNGGERGEERVYYTDSFVVAP